jgi:predicted DNA-binding transcriptional regulator AlpA
MHKPPAMPRTEAARPESRGSISERLLTARDAANVLRLSESWLAKSRMRGDGPPFVKIGRSVRYAEGSLRDWLQTQMRRSTSEQ